MTSFIDDWSSTTFLPTTPANSSNGATMLDDLAMDSNFVWLLCSLIFAISWVMYITYYNSRLTGYIITKIVNRLIISDGYFKIGSLTLNVLSGKIMFRDFVYITHDYTVRVQDGYLIFRWWRSYVPKDVSEDLSHSDTRLSVVLNGFELHVYNRGVVYARLEKVFGLDPCMFPAGSGNDDETEAAMNEENIDRQNSVQDSEDRRSRPRPEAAMARTWRDLIPVIKVDISCGRIVFGNRLVPTSLSITVEESHWVYSTKPAASTLDKLMHFVKCWAENARVMLAPSPKYTGMLDEPPRYMGEGFVLMATNYMELYAYMDEPGLVPEQPVLVRLANGDIVESAPPMWGIDIKCGKGTDFSYGPWADRQREHLFKFFYPNDFQAMKVTRSPKPGDKRQMHTFDIRLSMLNEATIDVLFSKNKETNAVHINVGAGSYLEITLPWIVLQDGCATKINGQLLHLEATTSLQFRDLLASETLEFSVKCHYPLIWNHHQQWELSLTGCKASVNIVYAHKNFFSDMINDWASKHRPDLMSFVPYTWRFGLTLKHCEVIIPSNMFNWIDCSSGKQKLENTRLALCAHLFHLSFDLPFEQFLPDTVLLSFSIQAESIDLSLFIPENNTSRNIILALDKYARVLSKEGNLRQKTENIPKWRNICQKSVGWVDFWWIPIGAISIQWVYHPAPPLGPQPQADISTPVKEELLLSPMRFPHGKKRPHRSPEGARKFDPMSLTPDRVTVELEIGPSVLLLYGTALRNFVHLKENIFGDDQLFTDMYQTGSQVNASGTSHEKSDDGTQEDFDIRYYRPLEVDVSVIMHDIQGHLLKFCSVNDPPCPVILVERFGFEMRKRYEQTELQLLLSPSVLLVSDAVGRVGSDMSLQYGRLALASLQLRGHAMFSDFQRSLDDDTVEYAWLLELQLGKLSGKITTPQLHQLVIGLETLVYLISDSENELSSPHISNKTSEKSGDLSVGKEAAAQVSLSTAVRQSLSNTGPQNSTFQALLQTRQNLKHFHADKQQPDGNSGMRPMLERPSVGPTNRVAPKQSAGTSGSAPDPNEDKKTNTEIDINQLAHKLKYKFCRVAIDAVDLWLVESGAALQLWMSPIRIANCNLHGKQVGSGLSCVIFNGMLRQLVCQTNSYKTRGSGGKDQSGECDNWLEVGAVSLGTLVVEAIMSPAAADHQVLQHRFLKQHDDKSRRLWFLWGGTRCGCIGGCAFFGNNKNGQKLFKPTQADLQDGVNVAAFKINEPGKDLGYGQSLLHESQLVFRTPPYTAQEILLHETSPRNPSNIPRPQATSSDRTTRPASPAAPSSASPVGSTADRRVNRRFSYTLTRNSTVSRDVPYARLVDPPTLPAKLDSDSKLHTDRGKTILNVPDSETGPKNSVSDSKLAVDYFTTSEATYPIGVNKMVSPQAAAAVASVNVSESHHSLSTRLGSEERLRQEVQRTISMSSENQSEAFFSADEDLNPSRTSSLRHSIIGSGTVLNQQTTITAPVDHPNQSNASKKKFASDLSIVADRIGAQSANGSTGNGIGGGSGPTSLTECVRTRLSSHRSDHEIHTPEHRSLSGYRTGHGLNGTHHGELLDEDRRMMVQGLATPNRKVSCTTNRSLSPRLPGPGGSPGGVLTDEYGNELQSVTCDSSDSRSLSSNSYVSAVCSQEDMTLVDLHMQLNRQICDSPLLMSSYVGHLSIGRCPNWSQAQDVSLAAAQPLFQRADDGGRRLVYVGGRFVPQMDIITEGFTLLKMAASSAWGDTEPEVNLEGDGGLSEEELLAWRTENGGSRTAVIVRLQGSLDFSATPLLLECLQRYIDVLTPTLASLHPLNVVTNLHAACVSQVEAQNTLKRDQDVTQRIHSKNSSTYEEFVRTQIQMAFVLPKVNITLLQASIVEEIISFSALDNIRDLTCVSLFALSFDNITARFHRGKQARELLQIFQRPTVLSAGKKLSKGAKASMAEQVAGEPVYIESSEKQQEEMVVSLNVGRVHGQLRRLRNDSSILNDAIITAIPGHHSKVMFMCQKVSQPNRGLEFYLSPNAPTTTTNDDLMNSEDKLGFIMFECGLDGVAIKVVKRSQFEKVDNGSDDKVLIADSELYCTESLRSRDDVDSVDNESTQTVRCSTQPPADSTVAVKDVNSGNTSSCVIELTSVWFNFAAPPRAPITRKLDYTRLDWNLLSTASPAINAWMNPSNRFAMRVVHLVRTTYRRNTGVVACLMAEALDVQQIHNPVRSKYGKLTTLASTLQEDPSCQLCTILERYIVNNSDVASVEMSLRDSELPQLSTLRQGVIVLSRQWKNVLYTPLLLDHNYKTRFVRPLNVTFAVPDVDEDICLTDGEASGNDDPDVTDECAMLLRTEALLKPKGGPGAVASQTTVHHHQTLSVSGSVPPGAPLNSPRVDPVAGPSAGPPAAVAVVSSGIESVLTSPSPPAVPQRRQRRVLPPGAPAASSRASVVFPTTVFGCRQQPEGAVAPGSDPSVNSQSSPDIAGSPGYQPPAGGPRGVSSTNTGPPLTISASCEDLYSWMAKQQEYVRSQQQQQNNQNFGAGISGGTSGASVGAQRGKEVEMIQREINMAPESKVNTLATDSSGEYGAPGGGGCMAGVSLYPMQDSLRLLDAHMIFQPLLSSLGVMPQQMVAPATQLTNSGAHPAAQTTTTATGSSLDSLGSNLSLVGSMEQMRIDIVVSEYGKGEKRSSGNGKLKPPAATLHLDISASDETPAFICERVSIELEVDKMADMTVDDMIRTRNVLYISRGQLKKHTSTALNFSVAARQISQQVNMPLLRLLHQITNMYQNVKETQHELREQQPELRRPPTVTETPPPHDITVTIAKNTSSSASDLQDVTLVDPKPIPLSLKVSDPSSIVSHVGGGAPKPVLSPSASVRSRPQSFAQKLRSTGKSVKGYMNLNEGIGTPLFNGSPSVSGGLTVASDKSTGAPGNCWKTVYHLLDLYATMPETKTITHRFSMAADISEHYKGTRKYDLLTEAKSVEDVEHGATPAAGITSTPRATDLGGTGGGERTRLIVFGVARIHRTRLLATLSGLKLEAEITNLHSSLTWRKKSKPASLEFSLTGQVGRTMIVLLEGVAPNQQTVVKVTVGKSQALYSSVSKRTKDKNSGLLTVGAVNIDIPQHPVALHGMVTRGSKQLSSTLQELRVTRTASRMSRTAQAEHAVPADDAGVQPPNNREATSMQHSSPHHQPQSNNPQTTAAQSATYHNPLHPQPPVAAPAAASSLLQPLVMQFSVILQSLSITAALLPSLQAQYKMDQVNSTGVTGSKAKFTIDLPHHSLSFTTKLLPATAEANLPSEASIALPAVHVTAEYVPESSAANQPTASSAQGQNCNHQDGLVLKKGGYLSAHADIGVFEHSLTTDLLNHLVFVQKVFMKEVNEVVQKVYGGERPVRLWTEDATDETTSGAAWSRILFSLVIRIQRIQLTATTAGSSAVRLETGAVALELSNRVQNVSANRPGGESVRLFGKAQVDVNLCLGQLTRNPMFEEAEPDFQQFAFFNTRIGLRNAFQDEMVDGENKEVVLITLKRPLVYIQPLAVDKAILVWLNYKNAYDYWNEKRANLNKEVLTATQQVFEKVPFGQFTSQLAAATGPNLGTLFLQLTVDDMGICLPLNPLPLATWNICGGGTNPGARSLYDESRGAVVITLESTSIAACSSGSLVSKGRFANLCLRFAEDFDPSLDDWKPDMSDAGIMNLCVVTEGTYEVCSRTIAAKTPSENAKWFLNVQWQMEGVDINLDVNVGKQLSALGHTLTMLTGAEDGPARSPDDDSDEIVADGVSRASQESLVTRCSTLGLTTSSSGLGVNNIANLPPFVLDPSLDAKKRSKFIEKEMSEQAKIINDLRSLGASHGTIEQEMRRLHELEALVFKDFRRDMIQKLRRQSVKASSIKGKLGLGSRSSAYRSKSFIIPSPTPERQIDTAESPEDSTNLGNMSVTSASFESSPRSGPSRTASLRVRNSCANPQGPRVTFSDRQNSLPSAESEISLSNWTQDGHLDIDGERVELRRKLPTASYESFDNGNSPLLDPFEARAGPHLGHMPQQQQPQQHQQPQQQQQQQQQKPQEPNIDFELDVKVLINSGKCVLHTKDPNREDELKISRMRKDRSCSAGLLEFPLNTGSPDAPRRNKDSKSAKDIPGKDSARSRGPTGAQAPHPNQLIDLTIFHIPGMDVKLHYESKVISDETEDSSAATSTAGGAAPVPQTANTPVSDILEQDDEENHQMYPEESLLFDQESGEVVNTSTPDSSKSSNLGITNPNYLSTSELDVHVPLEDRWRRYQGHNSGASVQRKPGVKRASLFAWMTLQSIPEETIISPHILEFLEQTLEPIPSKTFSASGQHSTTVFTTDTTYTANSQDVSYPGGYGTYVYTSFPVDVIVYFHMQPSTFRFSCLPVSRVECILQLPSLDIVFSSKRPEEEINVQDSSSSPAATAVGGLSVTGCLADFSVYIFHPYGGGKKSALKEAQWSPLSDSERKDSLSINVEFVKFHLSRSRKLNFQHESDPSGKILPDQSSRAVIRFSTIIDIGSASFKYDMRRLTEILAFPKAWYRRSIVRRLFLGDLSGIGAPYSDDGMDDTIPEDEAVPASRYQSANNHEPLSKSAPASDRSPMLSAREKLKLSLETDSKTSRMAQNINRSAFSSSESALLGNTSLGSNKHFRSSIANYDLDNTPSPSETKTSSAWETLVLFAVNFTRLNVHMNMGNVMGNVTWLTKDFRSEGRLSIGSTGHKNMYLGVGLAGSTLDAKGGIVGGTIEIANIDTYIHIREEPHLEPDHTVGLKLRALELRLDYMGTSVLMCRVSALDVTLRDEWRLNHGDSAPTRRPATIFVHGVLGWDQLQLMISKSSTADLIKMYHKLEEFFSQQFNSSKRVFSRLGPTRPQGQPNLAHRRLQTQISTVSSIGMDEARHHRHWQKALRHVAGLQLSTVHWPLPPTGTVLGGTVELRGQNISLACFHGINFKSKSWALFSLREPCISFNTEAQEIPSVSSQMGHDVHVVQTLTCSLGLSTYKTQHSMATVCKVSRNLIFPPQFKTLQEWFHYAFASSHIDEVDRFPSLEQARSGGSDATTRTQKLQDPNHTREIIFALPSLQLHLKTEHLQTATTPDLGGDKPTVECSFITEFEDHIFVTVDAEAFFFLHDLITSYLKEKERVFVSTTSSARASSPDPEKLRPTSSSSSSTASSYDDGYKKKSSQPPSPASFSPEDMFTKDWRSYQCKTWHMEPTVRLLSWAGKSIEPYGIDYILQKLGFSHARTTIPKWMQRGFMDPLDKVLAVLTLKMVAIIKDEKNERGEKKVMLGN